MVYSWNLVTIFWVNILQKMWIYLINKGLSGLKKKLGYIFGLLEIFGVNSDSLDLTPFTLCKVYQTR